jgi:hypothetical protein
MEGEFREVLGVANFVSRQDGELQNERMEIPKWKFGDWKFHIGNPRGRQCVRAG